MNESSPETVAPLPPHLEAVRACLEVDQDPRDPQKGRYHVLRGGSWLYFGLIWHSAVRYGNDPGYLAQYFAFRVVHVAPGLRNF